MLLRRGLSLVCCGLLWLACVWDAPVRAAQADATAAKTGAAKGAPDVLIAEEQRKAAPDFTLPDAQGRPIKLSSLKGRVVLLDFWATTCGGCKIELPWYVEFDQKYRKQGLAVVGVTMYGETWDIVKPFVAQHHMEYPVVLGDDALAARYGLEVMPMTLLIDREGKIAVSHAGIVNKDEFEGHIRELLR